MLTPHTHTSDTGTVPSDFSELLTPITVPAWNSEPAGYGIEAATDLREHPFADNLHENSNNYFRPSERPIHERFLR